MTFLATLLPFRLTAEERCACGSSFWAKGATAVMALEEWRWNHGCTRRAPFNEAIWQGNHDAPVDEMAETWPFTAEQIARWRDADN